MNNPIQSSAVSTIMHLKEAACFILTSLMMAWQENELRVEILETKPLDGIPSASGIVKAGSNLYMVGDDSPFLFYLDKNLKVISKTPIYSTEHLVGETIPKKHKPDFEAIELVGQNEIIVVGSGSKSPERDYFIKITLGEPSEAKAYNIASLYESLKKEEALQGHELNIEAVTIHGNSLFLFNRGENIIFIFNYNDFVSSIEEKAPFPKPQVVVVDLPKINGIEAGFSGATATQNTPNLIFTASVEDTENAYDDGEILGSFIGIIDISRIGDPSSYRYASIDSGNIPMKVESVTVQNEAPNREADLLLTTDSDGSESYLLTCRLRW